MFFIYLQWMVGKAELITQMASRKDMYGVLVPWQAGIQTNSSLKMVATQICKSMSQVQQIYHPVMVLL